MAKLVRTFIALAIALPDEASRDESPTPSLHDVLRSLSGMGHAVRAARVDQLHLTLKFLGPTHQEHIPEIARLMTEVASQEDAFDLTFSGLGAFPRQERPSVIWAGVQNPEPLKDLAAALDDSLASLNFGRETRPYRPHLTLARVKARPPETLRSLLANDAETRFHSSHVSRVNLYQSTLRPAGPVHEVLHSAPLRDPSTSFRP